MYLPPHFTAPDAAGVAAFVDAVAVGVELTIASVEAKHKLSQNRPAEDQAAVAEALRDEPGPGPAVIARLMARGG